MTSPANSQRLWRWLPLLSALVCVAGIYAVCVLKSGMTYLTNDDMSIQTTLSGVKSGEPYAFVPFVNVLVTAPLAALYAIAPSVQWWFAYSHALVVVGLVLMHGALLWAAHGRGRLAFVGMLLALLAADAALVVYPITKMGFTLVPGFVGAGLAAWIVCRRRAWSVPSTVLGLALYVLAVAHREESGIIVLCYLALALFSSRKLAQKRVAMREALRGTVVPVCVLVGVALVLVLGNKFVQRQVNGAEYEAYNDARSALLDYPHDTYDENPQLYQAVGWDGDLYQLVSDWCLMDECVTTHNLEYLSQNSRKQTGFATMGEQWDTLMEHAVAKYCLLAWAVIMVATTVLLLLSQRPAAAWLNVANVVGTLLLWGLQLYTGRILYRTVMVSILPSVAFALGLVLRVSYDPARRRVAVACVAAALLAMVPSMARSVSVSFDQERIQSRLDAAQRVETINDYAMAHPDLVFIQGSNIEGSTSPRRTYPGERPTNILKWGGSDYNSALHFLRIRRNGLDGLSGEVFSNDRVRFVCGTSLDQMDVQNGQDSLSTFYRWQRDRYGAVDIVQEDQICPGAYVMRLVFDED
ncbi:MAG: hypothetical protein Q4A01_07450 [Coriobacteriales bacterium]|nr:hypothetical protein [Coriobacteriales bacterium]